MHRMQQIQNLQNKRLQQTLSSVAELNVQIVELKKRLEDVDAKNREISANIRHINGGGSPEATTKTSPQTPPTPLCTSSNTSSTSAAVDTALVTATPMPSKTLSATSTSTSQTTEIEIKANKRRCDDSDTLGNVSVNAEDNVAPQKDLCDVPCISLKKVKLDQ